MAAVCATRYRARSPRNSPLYRLFEAHFDEVKGQREDCFERRCGLRRGLLGVPEVRRGDADHRVYHPPRCRGYDPEESREGAGAAPSRSTGHGSSLCRFLSLVSVAADCAGCVYGVGIWARDLGFTAVVAGQARPVAGYRRFGGRSTCRYMPWGSRTGLNVVLAWGGAKGNFYPSDLSKDRGPFLATASRSVGGNWV